MKISDNYKGKHILVLGLARSGMAAANLLHDLGANVIVNDAKELSDNPAARQLQEKGLTVVTGGHPLDLLNDNIELIVKNPGIPYTNPILEKAIEKEIPIITEVELAYHVSESEIIGITGTNGKTTTTSMIKAIFDVEEKNKALLAGNIGFPASEVIVEATREQVLITELSSFQLVGTIEFKPNIAVITNLFEAHIDYHGTRDEYVKAKWHIQQNMTESDVLIFNGDQVELLELVKTTKATVLPFSVEKVVEDGCYLEDDYLIFKGEKIMRQKELGVPGIHNIQNALAAIAVCKIYGVSNESIKTGLTHFSGVPHRTEFIGEYNGVKVYNDSKATNILATKRALSGFDNEHVVLIAGGLDRGNHFEELEPSLEGLKSIIILGEAKDKMATSARHVGVTNIILVNTMAEAVEKALEQVKSEDVLLLSPACASWDMYPDFETRGDDFVAEINKQVGKGK